MENKIKVGEYIRNKYGDIDKVKYISKYDDGDIHINTMRGAIYYRPREIVKHSSNLIDIIEDEDFCKIEFYSPRYEKRGTRIFEVSKIDEYITFENIHCDLFMINGEWSNNDKRLNPVIKEIYTKEMIESISYKVKRKD